ncbi:MAG: hypothetical protein NVS9B2_08510 [Steroidobacteraceae bacterium]
MPEIVARTDESAPQPDMVWQQRLDALICGECSEDEFLHELSRCRLLGADSAWSVVALLDQRYRRGQMPVELFRSIESKIARRELGVVDYGTTIELGIELSDGAAEGAQAPAPAAATAGYDTEIGRVLRNRYVLETRLGSGGMGTVFKALDRYRSDLPSADRFVAVKFLHEKAAGTAERLARLRREFYCAQALSHPNIVKVYELDRDGDEEFFTMEFLDGELLSRVIEHVDPLSMSRSRAWAIIVELAAGLAHAHARNVVHADLKPQNIMITKSGEVRILDFGASSTETAEKGGSSAVTPAYASCELLEGQRADPRDDLFALACVAYELLAGQHPFQRQRATDARDLGMTIQRPRGLTRQQWRTLSQGLAWRREERSLSVEDWIAQLYRGPLAARRSWRPARNTIMALLLAGASLPVIFNRHLFEGKPAPETVSKTARLVADIPPAAASPGPSIDIPPAAASPGPSIDVRPAAASPGPSIDVRPAAKAAPKRRTEAPQPAPRSPRLRAAPAQPRSDTVGIAANFYRVEAHKNFAEIHVQRAHGSGSDTSFIWWTEAASAQPGIDYVPQPRTVQLVSKRSRMASLFVKLVPNATRKHSSVFHVVIGEPADGTSLGRVTRTTISLPVQ